MKEPSVSPEDALRIVERVHDPNYVAEIRALSQRGGGFIDHDTCACVRAHTHLSLNLNQIRRCAQQPHPFND